MDESWQINYFDWAIFNRYVHKLPEARYGGTLIGLKWAIILVLLNDLAIATSLADFIENDGVKIATAHFPLTILQSNWYGTYSSTSDKLEKCAGFGQLQRG